MQTIDHTMTLLKEKYGARALVAGASEGIGAAYARYLAAAGMDLVLLARRKGPLEDLASRLSAQYPIRVKTLICDLSEKEAGTTVEEALKEIEVGLLVYNAALSYIGPYEKNSPEQHQKLASTNMLAPLDLLHIFGRPMLDRGRGAIILMASLAGFQGSGFLAAYAASKAFNRVLAESLWYEWKDRGVDVIACCAGATSTPGYINSKPGKTSFFAPKVQLPEKVVQECMRQLGKRPSYITGRGNRVASFFMQKILPRKMAVNLMGDSTRKMYGY